MSTRINIKSILEKWRATPEGREYAAQQEQRRREAADREWDRAWEPIEREQRVRRCRELEAKWAADDRADVPAYVVNPPSEEEDRAALDADAARQRVEDKIAAMHAHPAARSLKCGKGRVLHLHRDRGVRDYQKSEEARGRNISYKRAAKECKATAGDTEHALIQMCCGRSDCPFCWRRRLTRTYRRAVECLLFSSADSNRPRLGVLHLGETDPFAWETLDRNIRRRHGGRTGRLRCRKADCRILVVGEHPFAGSRPVSPAEALDAVSAAIDDLHTGRHAFRLLGAWNDAKKPRWRLLERVQEPIDFDAVFKELRDAGRKVRRFHLPEVSGVVWVGDGKVEASCPSLNVEESSSSRPNSDTDPPDGWEDHDPGGNPWT
jgi:hypothetical protein